MHTKEEIVADWLPRYTGLPLEKFTKHILLTNFAQYVDLFCKRFSVEVADPFKPMPTATNGEITIINFGMGSAMAATIMDLLSAVAPEAVLFLGKCGGLKKKTRIGDLVLPIAAIRGEGTSDDYLDKVVPALPSFAFQRAISSTIIKHQLDYWTGTVFTTNRRVWEHDQEFRERLRRSRAMAIDMETATFFVVSFVNKIPHGALLLVSDNPMVPEGVKTSKSDQQTNQQFVNTHLTIGLEALHEIATSGESIKHLRFEDQG